MEEGKQLLLQPSWWLLEYTLFMDFKYESLQLGLDFSEHSFIACVNLTRGAFHVVWHELVAVIDVIHLLDQIFPMVAMQM